jgi:prevent-host-death family protein
VAGELQFPNAATNEATLVYIAVRELKNHLSAYLKQVQTGEEIIITTHGNPVARLVRLAPNVQTKVSQLLDKLAWVRRGQGGKALGLPAAERIRLAGDQTLSDLLLKDRE